MGIEAVILTGGASRRMGRDKASLPIDGVAQAQRMVEALLLAGYQVTTLGRVETPRARFLPDAEEFAGPVAALARFEPREDFVFVASCDLPMFDATLVGLLAGVIEDREAAVPVSDSFRQPLCALYRGSVFGKLSGFEGLRCPTKVLDLLNVREVSESELRELGGDPAWTRGANTPEELSEALSRT